MPKGYRTLSFECVSAFLKYMSLLHSLWAHFETITINEYRKRLDQLLFSRAMWRSIVQRWILSTIRPGRWWLITKLCSLSGIANVVFGNRLRRALFVEFESPCHSDRTYRGDCKGVYDPWEEWNVHGFCWVGFPWQTNRSMSWSASNIWKLMENGAGGSLIQISAKHRILWIRSLPSVVWFNNKTIDSDRPRTLGVGVGSVIYYRTYLLR
jgi:hypothetical protein